MRTALNNDMIIDMIPSATSNSAMPGVSTKYTPINTMEVINMMQIEGWQPVQANQVKVRKQTRDGFQKHIVRFQHPNLRMDDGDYVDAVLTNGHDGKTAYNLFLGVFRVVCSNGMITGDTFDKISLKHVGLEESKVIAASQSLIEQAPKVAERVSQMKITELTPIEQTAFGRAAYELIKPKYAEDVADWIKGVDRNMNVNSILNIRRNADANASMWNTFNTVQENVVKGCRIQTAGRSRMRKGIKAIDKNVALNRALWTLADEMTAIKNS